MTSIFYPQHKHYAVHKAWVDGSFENPDKPPEVEASSSNGDWYPKTSNSWYLDCEYRIKPRSITRTISYPEPLKALVPGQDFWVVCSLWEKPHAQNYIPNYGQITMLKNGMCFATEADALECHKALFGTQE